MSEEQEVDLDVESICDRAVQVWPWAEAPEELREGFEEASEALIYVPARYVEHPLVQRWLQSPTLGREEGDGALVIACEIAVTF